MILDAVFYSDDCTIITPTQIGGASLNSIPVATNNSGYIVFLNGMDTFTIGFNSINQLVNCTQVERLQFSTIQDDMIVRLQGSENINIF